MWPFSPTRVFRNRWWTLAFAAFVCWSAMQWAGPDASEDADPAEVAAVAKLLE